MKERSRARGRWSRSFGEHYELGVVGDPVNVAARVQEATRNLEEPLLLTEATRCLLGDSHEPLRPRGTLSLRGKSEPVVVYGLAPVTVSGPLSSRDGSG